MDLIQDVVRAVRNLRALTMLGERMPLDAIIVAKRAADRALLSKHLNSCRTIAFLSEARVLESAARPPGSVVAVAGAVEVIVVEDPEPEGPFGAKGVGEIGLVPTAAAVAGALAAFDGVRRMTLPMKDSPAARAMSVGKRKPEPGEHPT